MTINFPNAIISFVVQKDRRGEQMMATNKYLRQLANDYLEKGKQRGFSEQDMYDAVHDLVFGTENQKFEEESLEENEKEELYRDLIVKRLTKDEVIYAKFPSEKVLNKTVGILYVIHQRAYDDTNGFINQIAEHEKIKPETCKCKMLSKYYGNMFVGIGILVNNLVDKSLWTRTPMDRRRECLEDMEAELFKSIAEEYYERSGRG